MFPTVQEVSFLFPFKKLRMFFFASDNLESGDPVSKSWISAMLPLTSRTNSTANPSILTGAFLITLAGCDSPRTRKKRLKLKQELLKKTNGRFLKGEFSKSKEPGKVIAAVFFVKLSQGITKTGNKIKKMG
jgi:hypothetical protein